tara:strand:- start:9158 stop:9595 length:438 start_codon:yes stop_codon:yes gene_type:complete
MADKLTPFTFINSINEGTFSKNLLKDCKADSSTDPNDPSSPDKSYVPFIINRGLSYFSDTVLFANEMNRLSHLPHRMQYDFLRDAVNPRKRFSKWTKKRSVEDDVKLIQRKYNYSRAKAEAVYPLFSSEEVNKLRKSMDIGGFQK